MALRMAKTVEFYQFGVLTILLAIWLNNVIIEVINTLSSA